jgi:uncharacterized heparinase superfamily protein
VPVAPRDQIVTDEMAYSRDTSPVWHIGKAERLFRRTWLFQWTLRGRTETPLLVGFPDHWRGSASRGSAIMTSGAAWRITEPGFERFDWLRDLRSFGGSQARSRARALISNWINRNARWDLMGWRPDIIATRLANLIFCYDWYAGSAEESFQHFLAKSVQQQARCLALDWQRLARADDRITALKGLFIAEAALGAPLQDLDKLMDLLIDLIDSRLHDDGGHKSRMPDQHLAIMRDLIEIRNARPVKELSTIKWLDTTIARMGAVCRMWRHGDGQFARFNGAGLKDPDIIEETLARGGQKGKLLQLAPQTGFVRFSSGRSTIIMDTGSPVGDADITGLSTLGFEFSVGQNLLVVNPGQIISETNFQRLLESTNAHSTLTIDGISSSDFASGRVASVADLNIGPAEGGFLAVASHNGYAPSHGIIHQRKLYLTTGGGNLRGADRLEYTGAPGQIGRLATVRFHLHPRVTAAILNDQRILMKIRGNRTGWTFRANGTVSLDTSLFFDISGRMSCQQIVVTMPLDAIRSVGAVDIKWAFQRNDSGS